MSGGNGIVILQYVTNTGTTSNVALTGTNTYYVPTNTASFKIWAIGAGGGSSAGSGGDPGGGAGGIAYMSVTGGYNGGSGGGGGNGTVSSNGWVTNLLQYAGPGGGGGGAAPAGNVTTLTGSSGTAGSGGYYGGGGGGGITGSSGAPGLLAISYVPTGYSNVSDVDDLLVLRSNFVPGNMYACGSNTNGQLGNGTTTAVSSPIHIGSATDWKETSLYSAGYSSAAISTSGNLYVWGSNGSGLLGLGDTTDRSVPTQLGPLTTWKQISFGGANSAVAIKSDGSMWGWGSFTNYQLGNGLASGNASSPVQVGKSLYNWKQVATGNQFGLAIAIDGTLWAWGLNSTGQLGQPDLTFPARSTPVQVGTLTSWKYVAVSSSVSGGSSYGITADGSLWAWGYNGQGQLGLGDTVNRSVPAQIGTGVWRSVAAGLDHVVAVNASGKLFTWGNNNNGQLGQNTVTASGASSPVQVGLLSDWKTAIAGSYSSGGIKSDNTFWTWGANASGQLGQGNVNGYSSPTQVGSLTTWKSAGIGQYHALATIYSF
jgi:alpha-tubulin suppressor-like RCC1 family protein